MDHPQFYQKCAGLPKSEVYDIVLGLPQHSFLLYIYISRQMSKKEIPIFQCFNPHFGWYFPIFSHIFVASFPPIVPYFHISRDISRKTCPPSKSRAASRGRHGKKGSFRGITLEELIPVFLKAYIYIYILYVHLIMVTIQIIFIYLNI